MKNNFNENNYKELDKYNKNIYKMKKLFGLRPKKSIILSFIFFFILNKIYSYETFLLY